MIIPVVRGTGAGTTTVGAFDAALNDAGIANRNLIGLSSVIPDGAVVTPIGRHDVPGGWGDRLYVVLAQQYATKPGQEAWAGIGWGHDGPQGLFVHGEGESEAGVKQHLEESLDDLARNRRITLYLRDHVITGTVCADRPVCAVAAAVFTAEGWV
jgi:arginine decarboxylase